jgi:hypothetical protein
MFGFYDYEQFHSYVNAGTILQLQKLFTRYYYSSTYCLDEFFVDVRKDAAHYEHVLLPMLSTETICFYSSNQAMSRIEKERLISDFEQSYDWLLVCPRQKPNCGKCGKCIRTMVGLDFVGKLQLYRASFDVDEYFRERDKCLGMIVQRKERDHFMKELYDYAMAHDIALPSPEHKNIVNRVFDSVGQRGVRQTLSIALQRLMRREL